MRRAARQEAVSWGSSKNRGSRRVYRESSSYHPFGLKGHPANIPPTQAQYHFDEMLTCCLENNTELLSSVYIALKICKHEELAEQGSHNLLCLRKATVTLGSAAT